MRVADTSAQSGYSMIEICPAVPDAHQDPVRPAPPAATHADVCERLLMEFGPVHGLRLVSEILRRCRVELAARPGAGTPVALERLARTMIAAGQLPLAPVRAS
jgi:hypothetical protein